MDAQQRVLGRDPRRDGGERRVGDPGDEQFEAHSLEVLRAQGPSAEVHSASGVFEPAQVTAKKGDILRFVNDGGAAHNANFAGAPENAGKSGLPGATPYATAAGQSVDVPVTMEAGTYTFQCDPHAAMGMKGQLTVQ